MRTAKTSLENALSAIANAESALGSIRALVGGDSTGPIYLSAKRAERELEAAKHEIELVMRGMK